MIYFSSNWGEAEGLQKHQVDITLVMNWVVWWTWTRRSIRTSSGTRTAATFELVSLYTSIDVFLIMMPFQRESAYVHPSANTHMLSDNFLPEDWKADVYVMETQSPLMLWKLDMLMSMGPYMKRDDFRKVFWSQWVNPFTNAWEPEAVEAKPDASTSASVSFKPFVIEIGLTSGRATLTPSLS